MDQIRLVWQGPYTFNELDKLPEQAGIYINSLKTNPERILYVGRASSIKERHKDYLDRYSNYDVSTILIDKILDKDFYNFCSNDQFNKRTFIFLEPNLDQYIEFKNALNEDFYKFIKINNKKLKDKTNIYYAIPESEISDNILKLIEANIQYFLIKNFKLDLFSDYNYKIGFTKSGGQNKIDQSIKLINNYNLLKLEAKLFFLDHFINCKDGIINLEFESDLIIKKIQNRKVSQKWSDIYY